MKIISFNVENLDDKSDTHNPGLNVRAPILRAELVRADADIICLQEVHGQETPQHTSNDPDRVLSALDEVLSGTNFENYNRVFTKTNNTPYNERNLVILSRFPIVHSAQYRNTHIDKLQYKKVTADPAEDTKDVRWERPILHAEIQVQPDKKIHIINLHLKSRLASNINGQKNGYEWASAAGWAEGYFLSSLKRVGQALETRILIDKIFDNDPDASIIVCGDFNSEPGEVPVEAIRGRVEDTNNPTLRPRVLVPCGHNIPDSIKFSHLHQGHGNLLDHMLMSQSLMPLFSSAQIFNENLHDESMPFAFETKFPESDHAAFVAEFNI